MDLDTRIQKLEKDKAVNMNKDQEESNEQEQSKEQELEATKGEAHNQGNNAGWC